MRRTKIVATVGPASESPQIIQALITAGVNVFRLNFSHGNADEHRARCALIRSTAAASQRHVALMGDLQGPKIRLRTLAVDKIALQPGSTVVLDTAIADGGGDDTHIGVDYEPLPKCVDVDDVLLLDDGRISLRVKKVAGTAVHCVSESKGPLTSRKGINKLGGGLSAPALTEKDIADIAVIAELNLEFVAVSFPSSAEDMRYARQILDDAGSGAALIAKVERAEAVENHEVLDELILASDGVMVARGDLGVEIGDAHLIALQKHLIKRARVLNRFVITATQMMESMTTSAVPTRAEVFDVANAVLDGTDAVMLSAETASGSYPVETVEAMARTCEGAEQYPGMGKSSHRLDRTFFSVDETIAMSAIYAANHMSGVKAIVALTETGNTALLMSRLSSNLPILAFSRNIDSCNKMAMYRGVMPLAFDFGQVPQERLTIELITELLRLKLVAPGDFVLYTRGTFMDEGGATDTLKIIQVS